MSADTWRDNDVLLRQNDVAASFWRNNNVIITSCARWGLAEYVWWPAWTNIYYKSHGIATNFNSCQSSQVAVIPISCVCGGARMANQVN